MRKEVAISGAIIGASFVAAVVIAGGPSGIWPSEPGPVSVVGSETWHDGSTTGPTSTAPAETDAAARETVDGETVGGETDGAVVDGTQVASSSVTVPGVTITQGTVVTGGAVEDDGPRDRSAARVAVANGAGIAGAASERAAELAALGYTDPAAVNAEPFAFTLVYAAEGWEAEGARLAEDTGLPATAVFPLAEAPVLETTAEFDLVLVLGSG